jgi:hypothetical protein
MMDLKKYTFAFIIGTILSIAVFDFVIIAKGGTEASISHMLITWSYDFPAFTFLFGFVAGHLFWRLRTDKKD